MYATTALNAGVGLFAAAVCRGRGIGIFKFFCVVLLRLSVYCKHCCELTATSPPLPAATDAAVLRACVRARLSFAACVHASRLVGAYLAGVFLSDMLAYKSNSAGFKRGKVGWHARGRSV